MCSGPVPPREGASTGKWLLFPKGERVIDDTWALLKAATESGELGFGLKISLKDPSAPAINVYVEEDRKDEVSAAIVRVLKADKAFLPSSLRFKTDEATAAGQYSRGRGGRGGHWQRGGGGGGSPSTSNSGSGSGGGGGNSGRGGWHASGRGGGRGNARGGFGGSAPVTERMVFTSRPNPCNSFSRSGSCIYGDSCHYLHEAPGAEGNGGPLDTRFAREACLICEMISPVSQGLHCKAPTVPHFVCSTCLEGMVSTGISVATKTMPCPHAVTVRGRLEERCPSAPWTIQELCGVLSAQAIAGALTRTVDESAGLQERLQDAQLAALTLPQQLARILEGAASPLQAAPKAAAAIREALNFRCPRCKTVFGDWDNCDALTCHSASCGAAFCGLCFVDCGKDAHPHASQQHGSAYSSPAKRAAEHRAWRLKVVRGGLMALQQAPQLAQLVLAQLEAALQAHRIDCAEVAPPAMGSAAAGGGGGGGGGAGGGGRRVLARCQLCGEDVLEDPHNEMDPENALDFHKLTTCRMG